MITYRILMSDWNKKKRYCTILVSKIILQQKRNLYAIQ